MFTANLIIKHNYFYVICFKLIKNSNYFYGVCNSERVGGAACCPSTLCFDVT
ncbi:hypothetical protein Hanom_Chr16g01485321 [Helianthus anomalus]